MERPSLPTQKQLSISHWCNFNSLELLGPKNAVRLGHSSQKKKKCLLYLEQAKSYFLENTLFFHSYPFVATKKCLSLKTNMNVEQKWLIKTEEAQTFKSPQIKHLCGLSLKTASELELLQSEPDSSKCLLLKSLHITHITKPYYFRIHLLLKCVSLR